MLRLSATKYFIGILNKLLMEKEAAEEERPTKKLYHGHRKVLRQREKWHMEERRPEITEAIEKRHR